MAYDVYPNIVTHKAQLAAQAMLVAAVTAGTIDLVSADSILAGIGNDNVPLPRIVCVSKRATVEEIYDGNWDAELIIRVIASAQDTTAEQFHEICGQIFGHFFQAPSTVCTQLSNVTIQFTAQAVYPRSQSWDLVADENDATWESELMLNVKCCGSVIA